MKKWHIGFCIRFWRKINLNLELYGQPKIPPKGKIKIQTFSEIQEVRKGNIKEQPMKNITQENVPPKQNNSKNSKWDFKNRNYMLGEI